MMLIFLVLACAITGVCYSIWEENRQINLEYEIRNKTRVIYDSKNSRAICDLERVADSKATLYHLDIKLDEIIRRHKI